MASDVTSCSAPSARMRVAGVVASLPVLFHPDARAGHVGEQAVTEPGTPDEDAANHTDDGRESEDAGPQNPALLVRRRERPERDCGRRMLSLSPLPDTRALALTLLSDVRR
jgi:hypothetical protein